MTDARKVPETPVQPAAKPERLLSAREVAEQLQVSVQFVFDHASGRKRPAMRRLKMGGAVRFRQEHVDEFVRCCEEILNGRA
jgi:predicted DNA-binding transcriptional regulator AlpA